MQDNSDLIIRDCCEAEVAQFGKPDTICITVDVLREIVQRHSPGPCLQQIQEPAAASAAVAVADEHAAFEIWWGTPHIWSQGHKEAQWNAWQARAALTATPAAVPVDKSPELQGSMVDKTVNLQVATAAPVVLPEPARETLEEAASVLSSINHGKQHAVKVGDEVCYWQRQEWIEWAEKEVLPKLRALLAAAPAHPAEGVPTVGQGEVLVTVSGFTGSGKSAIAGEIEIMCRALGLQVDWPDSDSEKHMTHADWIAALEQYKPRVRIVECNVPHSVVKGQDK